MSTTSSDDDNEIEIDDDNDNDIINEQRNSIITRCDHHKVDDESSKRRLSIKPLLINIDARSHLEVADIHHRYSKNLRLYFQEYIRCDDINWEQEHQEQQQQQHHHHQQQQQQQQEQEQQEQQQQQHHHHHHQQQQQQQNKYHNNREHFAKFFNWLDSSLKPEHPSCARSLLDSDTVLYLTTFEQRKEFAYQICNDGLLRKYNNHNSCSSCNKGELLNTDNDGWIFVLKDKILYAHTKDTKSRPRFHHSTFLAGEAVEAAGLLVAKNGVIMKLFPHSGHYRPHDHHLLSMLEFFNARGVSLSGIQVDIQRVLKVSRLQSTDGEKMKKINTVHMMNGLSVLFFLRTKDKFITSGTASLICLTKLTSQAAINSRGKSESLNDSVASLDSETSSFYSKDELSIFSPLDISSKKYTRASILTKLLFEERTTNSAMKLSIDSELETMKILLLSDSPVG